MLLCNHVKGIKMRSTSAWETLTKRAWYIFFILACSFTSLSMKKDKNEIFLMQQNGIGILLTKFCPQSKMIHHMHLIGSCNSSTAIAIYPQKIHVKQDYIHEAKLIFLHTRQSILFKGTLRWFGFHAIYICNDSEKKNRYNNFSRYILALLR